MRARNDFLVAFSMVLCAASLSSQGRRLVTETAEFTGAAAPAGWVVADGSYLSPEYSNAVGRIAFSYGAAEGVQLGEAQLFAIGHAGGAETQIASVNTLTAGASFDFPAVSDYRRFRVAADGLSLATFSATWLDTRLDAPTNIVATALTTDSLEVSWAPVEGAGSYRVAVWTNVIVGADAGSVVWEDAMPGATNGASSTRMSDAKFSSCFANAGWTRSEKAGYSTDENGTIRIGITGESGWLQTPPIDVSGPGAAIRFRARIGESNANPVMRVELISGNATSLIAEVALDSQLKEYLLAIPGWKNGDSVRFNSFASGDRRTVLGGFAFVTGYSEGVSSPVIVSEEIVAGGTSCTIVGLQPVPVCVGVSAIDGDNVPSEMSAGVEVDLANPPPRVMLNACPLSSLEGHLYSQDFDSLAYVTSTSDGSEWKNGSTLPFWQAFQDGLEVDTVSLYKGGNATGARFLVLATNENDVVRALGARVRGGTTTAWGLAFTNDTDFAVILTNVAYSTQQWGFANNTNQLLSCEYLVTNRLDWIVGFDDGWHTCDETEAQVFGDETHQMPETTNVDYVPPERIRIAPGEVFYLKWVFHPPAKGSSALMAIDDLSVRFDVPEHGFLMRLVKSQEPTR